MPGLIILDRSAVPAGPALPRTDEDLCIGCGVCVRVCPVEGANVLVREEVVDGVFAARCEVPGSKKDATVAMLPSGTVPLSEFCIICRRCVAECPTGARAFP